MKIIKHISTNDPTVKYGSLLLEVKGPD